MRDASENDVKVIRQEDYKGVVVNIVEPGTVLGEPHSGFTVTDVVMVKREAQVFCTEKAFETLKYVQSEKGGGQL